MEMNESPDNNTEGYGSEKRDLHTPEVMRDCLLAHYWEDPARSTLGIGAARLADDFKRRGFSQLAALGKIKDRMSFKLDFLKPEDSKQIEKAVSWAYKKQEHPLTCNGVLMRDSLCHKTTKACRFHEIDTKNREFVRSLAPVILPAMVEKCLQGIHPTDALFARWTYTELMALEQQHNLMPGNEKQPILIGFRELAGRVGLRNRQVASYTKDTALKSVRLLEDNGIIKRVVRGTSGTRRGRALSNGYIRIMTPPPGDNTHITHV